MFANNKAVPVDCCLQFESVDVYNLYNINYYVVWKLQGCILYRNGKLNDTNSRNRKL